jgi:protein tyrosine phosphatase type 4A
MTTNMLVSKPSVIQYKHLKFLIMDAPKETNLHLYLKECKKHNVAHIARISEPSYSKKDVEKAGISLHEFYFDDGASPPEDILNRWCSLVEATFDSSKPEENPCIAIHCVAGLGRAPVLVAIALVEHGLDAITSVTTIREKR